MKSLIGLLVIGLLNLTAVGTFSGVAFAGSGTQVHIQIHSLNGQQLADYSTYSSQRTLSFRPLDYNGRPLANGVYLAVVTVKNADGTVVDRQITKMVVLRGKAQLSTALDERDPEVLNTAPSDGKVTASAIIGTKSESWPFTYYMWRFDRWEIEQIARDYSSAFSAAHLIVWQMIREKAPFISQISCAPYAFIPCDGVIAGISKHFHAYRLQALARDALARQHYTMYYQHAVDNRAVALAKYVNDAATILEILKQLFGGYVR